MIGGAPVTKKYAVQIGADSYRPDAASAAEWAADYLKENIMFKSLEYYKPNIDETVKWYQKMYHDALNHKKVTFLLGVTPSDDDYYEKWINHLFFFSR